MKPFLLFLPLIICLSNSCKTPKQAPTPEPVAQTSDATVPAADPQKPAETCRLIVSFISIGEGTDPKARETMDQVITNWQERSLKTFEMESIPWGREGEVDFCFQLKELNVEEQSLFVTEIKSAFEGNNLVQITENEMSRFKK